ncbi:MAG: SLOG family protein [Evtepia sp.]
MKVAIIGSRGIHSLDLSTFVPENCTLIVSGGAMGVDTLAEQYAAQHKIQTMIIRPDYKKYGRSAPIRRNNSIVDHSDMVLAFWDGESRGTKYTIDYANAQRKPVKVVVI